MLTKKPRRENRGGADHDILFRYDLRQFNFTRNIDGVILPIVKGNSYIVKLNICNRFYLVAIEYLLSYL